MTDAEYCDWCYSGLTQAGRAQSLSLGLPLEDAWACAECITSGDYRTPPDGWDGDDWPARHTYLFSDHEHMILANALNEILHGPDAIEESEFDTRIGANRDETSALSVRLGGLT